MSKFIPFVKSPRGITVYLKGKPHNVPSDSAQFDAVVAGIDAGDEDAVLTALNGRALVVAKSFGQIEIDDRGNLSHNGTPLRGPLVDRILTVIRDAGDAGPLLAFLDNLVDNPSRRAVEELYTFLEVCDLPITADGHFLAYKRVRDDYKDVHSGQIDNSVGQLVQMKRYLVDEDQTRTCSVGLHFCSKGYLGSFGGEKIVVLKINPADVVAIPVDYEFSKGRCWRYEVVDELDTATYGGDSLPVKEIKSHYTTQYAKSPAPLVEDAEDTDGTVSSVSVTVTVTSQQGSLSDATVREIRKLLGQNWTVAGVAREVGTSARTVARIRDGETYTNVK